MREAGGGPRRSSGAAPGALARHSVRSAISANVGVYTRDRGHNAAMINEQDPNAPQPLDADPPGEDDAPEFDENNKPGVTDFFKAAKEGVKALKKQDPS